MKLLLGPVMMAFCFTLFRTIPPRARPADVNLFASQEPALFFVFKKAQTLSVSSDIHGNYDCCHMTLT